ncbi:unnamed protein product [Mytilus coruscus]|uniref:Uncharacterized protein n=1 Tax=Mytilus coruscus TaxID=42192 RepID=A0A6J8BXV9_MYTCO|nr:unnamed protein product [Mytilus coruscus]
MDIKILTTTIVTTFVLTTLIQLFKCIPIARYWIILYFILTPHMVSATFYVFIKVNANVKEQNVSSDSFDRGRTYTFDKRFPICKRKLKQYIGEDLKLSCLWHFIHMNNHQSTEYNARWTLNGSGIVNSDRITLTSFTIEHFYSDILRVSSIDKNDYGEYQLWISFNETNDKIQNNRNTYYMIAQMFLIQADDILNYVYVPVGNAVLLRYMFPFDNLIAKGNFSSIECQIESKLIGKITFTNQSERFSQGCSRFTYIVLTLFDINRADCATTDGQGNCNFYMCTSSISFGKHSIIFMGTIFNVTTKLNQRVEVVLPTKYIVLSEETNYSNNQSEYQVVKDINEIDLSYEEKHLFIRNASECTNRKRWPIESNKILLIKRDHCDISNVLKKKFTVINAIEEFTRESDTLDTLYTVIVTEPEHSFDTVSIYELHDNNPDILNNELETVLEKENIPNPTL